MTRFKKISLSLLLLFLTAGMIGYVYLFIDTQAYPDFNKEGLHHIESGSITAGKTVSANDSNSRNITMEREWFKDGSGRVMNLRGINLAGSSKMPFSPKIATHVREGLFESARAVSFVGRPFPLDEADVHFSRLKNWGFQFVRLLITWEAIEHEGPGIYDHAYLDYIYQIVLKAQQYDINVFIDPHQDAWSRFTGGDGAPLWTLEKVGFDATKFSEAGSAIVHNVYGDPFPKTIWPTNDSKLAACTMFTLFFGGNDFAPQTKVEGVPIQNYLQDHYINAVLEVAKKLRGLKNVIGFDTLNEPVVGYIGLNNLDTLGLLRMGAMPTYFQGMKAGDGITQEVGFWKLDLSGFQETGKVSINKAQVRVWNKGYQDIWRQHGVWRYDAQHKPLILKKNYFSQVNGHRVHFSADYWKPFAIKFANEIRKLDKEWIIFAEPALFTRLPEMTKDESYNMVNAGHWYDGVTVVTLKYFSWLSANEATLSLVYGRRNVREHFDHLMGELKVHTTAALGERPTLMGEFGIPFDLNNKKSYTTGDFSDQEAALDRSFNAMESNLLNYTLWNYSNDNDNAHGDQWNGEDFSVFSLSQQKEKSDINSGGRALRAVIRPYPYKVSGIPIQSFFNKEKVEYLLRFRNDPSITAPTEIFLPVFHFGNGYEVWVTRGRVEQDTTNHLLLYFPSGEGEHQVVVRGK